MATSPQTPLREEIVEWALVIILSPILLFISIWDWMVVRYYVWRPIDSAWRKCAARWSRGHVEMKAPHVEPTLNHGLAVAMGNVHRKHADFFVRQLRNEDPVLVGYAFKCLIRAKPSLQIEDIPAEVLERIDHIPTIWADLGSSMEVGEFVKGYFAGQDLRSIPR